jgi:pilus assembly protein CpaE
MRVSIVSLSPDIHAAREVDELLRTELRCAIRVFFHDHVSHLRAFETADCVIFCIDSGNDAEIRYLERVKGSTSAPVFAVGPADHAKLILRVLRAGADQYFDQGDIAANLKSSILAATRREASELPQGKIVAVLSACGGCGASTVAANLAVAHAQESGQCALIDMDCGQGDLAALLDLKPQYTIADLCRNDSRLDHAIYRKMLVSHMTGVALLAAPKLIDEHADVHSGAVRKAIRMSQELFPTTVIDLKNCHDEEQLAALERADGILLICKLEFNAMRNARKVIENLVRKLVARHRIRMVINQHGQPNDLQIDEVEDALGERLKHFIPYDPITIGVANNLGVPVMLRDRGSKIAQVFRSLARINFDQPASENGTKHGER